MGERIRPVDLAPLNVSLMVQLEKPRAPEQRVPYYQVSSPSRFQYLDNACRVRVTCRMIIFLPFRLSVRIGFHNPCIKTATKPLASDYESPIGCHSESIGSHYRLITTGPCDSMSLMFYM